MTSLSSIQIPTYMVDIFKYSITIIMIAITVMIVTKCICSIIETIRDLHDSDNFSDYHFRHSFFKDEDEDDYDDYDEDDDEEEDEF